MQQMISQGTLERLQPGTRQWSNASSSCLKLRAGEGVFHFDALTVGLVLVTQREHWGAYGGTRLRRIPLGPGSGWIFPAGIDGRCSWRAQQLFINVSLSKALFAAEDADGVEANAFSIGSLDPLASQLVLNIHAAENAVPALYRESLSVALAAHVARLKITESGASGPDPRIARVIAYIEEHLGEELELARLAGIAALSPFHFLRLFKAETGRSPHQHVMIRRMERAVELITKTRRPIADIAWSLGYEDASHFAAQFKRHAGITPGSLRSR